LAFVLGLLPRAGPSAAAMQLPLLTAFAYSAAFPLSVASVGARVGAVLVALPVYVLGAAVLFQTDARRPLVLGAAAGLGGVAEALGHVEGSAADAARTAELGLVRFRVATGRLKDAALPVGESLDSRAGRLLAVSVQQAVAATELVVASGDHDARRRDRIATLGGRAAALAGALSGTAPLEPPDPLDALARIAAVDDPPVAALAEALADTARAVAVLRGESHELPAGLVAELPGPLSRLRGALTFDDPIFRQALRLAAAAGLAGLIAALLDLSRIYWAVFAAVVVLNAPPARDMPRALMRIAGTVLGFVLAIGLVALVGHDTALAFGIALVALLAGLILTPINYAASVTCITCMVSMLYTVSGEESDFLKFRVLDNAVGVAAVAAVGLLLARSSTDDWWRVARLTARSLAAALTSTHPAAHRGELITRALQLRTETVDAAALPDATPEFAASWSFLAAAENLIRILTGPKPTTEPIDSRRLLARQLQTIAEPGSPTAPADEQPPDPPPPPTTLAAMAVTQMSTAVAVLRRP
jgi:uncharacterized membrane protein YccC